MKVDAETTGLKGPWREVEVQHGISESPCGRVNMSAGTQAGQRDGFGSLWRQSYRGCESPSVGAESGTQVLSKAVCAIYG